MRALYQVSYNLIERNIKKNSFFIEKIKMSRKNTKNKVRMVDIAQRAGVSLATVGRVLQGTGRNNIRVGPETAQKVRHLAKELNYIPNLAARQLAGKKSHTLGILLDPRHSPANSIRFSEMGTRARQKGYHLMALHEMPDTHLLEECLGEFKSRGVDGVICMHHAYPGQYDLVPKIITGSGIENVIFIDEPSIQGTTYIGVDFAEIGRQMVNYLLGQGRKRIAFVCSDLDWYTGPHFHRGYVEALVEKGLKAAEELIWVGTRHREPDSDLNRIDDLTAQQIIYDLVKNKGADAIVVTADLWAAQILNSLVDQGYQVPGDVAITGSGDLDVSRHVRPKLTTADLCYREVSHKAVDMLIEMIENDAEKPTAQGVFVNPKIIIRDSAQ